MLSRAKFQLKPSRHLTLLGVLAWGVLGACAVNIAGISWLALIYALGSAVAMAFWLRRYAWLRASSSVVAVSWTPEEFCCYLRNGEQINGVVLPKSAFYPQLITLHLITQDGVRFWWLMMGDSGPTESLRKLRVFGRWYQQAPLTD